MRIAQCLHFLVKIDGIFCGKKTLENTNSRDEKNGVKKWIFVLTILESFGIIAKPSQDGIT